MTLSRRAGLLAAVLLLAAATSLRAAAPPEPRPAMPESSSRRVLIASESSPFKDGLVKALVARLREQKIEPKVIEIAALVEIEGADWAAIVLVHTWEADQPPAAVSSFISRTRELGRIIDITTSSSGVDRLREVDAISSASVVDETPQLVGLIDARIQALLASK